MKSSPSFKLSKRTKYLIALGLLGIYFLGFASQAYSPAHISHYAIPIPRLIPIVGKVPDNNGGVGGKLNSSDLATTAPDFTHTGIITTFFWVGEPADSDNGNISNTASAWDGKWQRHYGGIDSPAPRNGYNPTGFIPSENPFYFALPYSDIDNKGNRKPTAANCPLAVTASIYSWCKNSWIVIRHGDSIVYAQWEDAGPFGENDVNYVFSNAAPANKQGPKAGLDVSPAVRDYLGLKDVDVCDWGFIKASAVPDGPWKLVITTTPGDPVNN